MALNLSKHTLDPVQRALVSELNNLRNASVGTNVHGSITAGGSPSGDPPVVVPLTTTLPVASDLPTSKALANDLLRVVNTMFADVYAHKTASPAVATPSAIDLPTAITLANALKAAANTHFTAAGVHFNNDGTNTITSANATIQSDLNTLLNEMRTKLPAHILLALAGQHILLTRA
jgi:hypothetical protein